MGKGIDLAREDSPLHAQVLDDFKDQLLLALIRRQAVDGKLSIPVAEVDATGQVNLMMAIDPDTRTFHFEIKEKH